MPRPLGHNLMDTVQHAVAGYAIGTVFHLPVEQCAIVAVVSTAPDVLAWGYRIKYPDSWSFYNTLHDWETLAYGAIATIGLMLAFQSFLPLFCWAGYGLHLALDSFTHEDGMEWWVWPNMMWAEILGWLLLIGFFAWHLAK